MTAQQSRHIRGSGTLCKQCRGRGIVHRLRATRAPVTTDPDEFVFLISRAQFSICPTCAGRSWLAGLLPPV